jgi:tRNA(Ile2) C34 agmatinyltransferase TiaS
VTIRIGNVVIIAEEKPQQCDLCGKIAELRPYGPNSEYICWECGEKNPEETDRQMFKQLFGRDVPPDWKHEEKEYGG